MATAAPQRLPDVRHTHRERARTYTEDTGNTRNIQETHETHETHETQETEERWLSQSEAARLYGISQSAISYAVLTGRLRAERFIRGPRHAPAWRIREHDVRTFSLRVLQPVRDNHALRYTLEEASQAHRIPLSILEAACAAGRLRSEIGPAGMPIIEREALLAWHRGGLPGTHDRALQIGYGPRRRLPDSWAWISGRELTRILIALRTRTAYAAPEATEERALLLTLAIGTRLELLEALLALDTETLDELAEQAPEQIAAQLPALLLERAADS